MRESIFVGMKRKIIAGLIAVSMPCAILALFPLSVKSLEVAKVHVPGGEVSSREEFFEALGGEKTVLADSLCLKTDIILDSPLVLAKGDYVLTGAGCTVTKGFAKGDMIVIRSGASLRLGDENHIGDYADITLSGNVVSRLDEDGAYLREVEEPLFAPEDADGSLIAVERGSFTVLLGVILENNYSRSSGGCIRLEHGSVSFDGGSILGCGTAGNGGGVSVSAGSTFRMLSGTVSDCYAQERGGGLYTEGTAELAGGTVSRSGAKQGGGLFAAAAVSFTEFVLSENRAEQGGGVFFAADTEVSGCSAMQNTAEQGGGVYNAAVLDVSGLGTYRNSAVLGAGLYNAGTITMSACYFSENEASGQGGGIFNSENGVLTWSGGTLASNSAKAGGGIMNLGTLTQSGGVYLVNKADAGTALCNLGYLTFSGSVCISNIATVVLVPGSGEAQGIIRVAGKLTAETVAVIVPGKSENGVISVDYDSTTPFLAGSEEDVRDAHEKIKVKENGDQKYALNADGTLKTVHEIPRELIVWGLIGCGTVLCAGLISWLLIRKRKKADQTEVSPMQK